MTTWIVKTIPGTSIRPPDKPPGPSKPKSPKDKTNKGEVKNKKKNDKP